VIVKYREVFGEPKLFISTLPSAHLSVSSSAWPNVFEISLYCPNKLSTSYLSILDQQFGEACLVSKGMTLLHPLSGKVSNGVFRERGLDIANEAHMGTGS
jgi:hypothetical protein